VLDLLRRVVATLGLDVELATAPPLNRSQLSAFTDAVAAYVDADTDASGGLLAHLRPSLIMAPDSTRPSRRPTTPSSC
jgi:hypothetical protein